MHQKRPSSPKRKWLLMLAGLYFLFSCEEIVNPELISSAPIYVVDGTVSSRIGDSKVIITQTVPFNQQEANPRVSGAIIGISDNQGNSYRFIETLEKGVYRPVNTQFGGKPGITYQLSVVVNENNFSATATMPAVPTIDSLSIKERRNDLFFADGYYLTIHFQEPETQKNYYKWETYLNQNRLTIGQVDIFDDKDFNGQYLNFEILEPIAIGPEELPATIVLDLFALNREGFNYFQGLRLLTQAGSPSQAVPENPISNISGGAIGFFNAIDVLSASVEVLGE